MVFALSGATSFVSYNLLSGNEQFYSNYAMPTLHRLIDGEAAHNLAIKLAKHGLVPKAKQIKNAEILVRFKHIDSEKNISFFAYLVIYYKSAPMFLIKNLKIQLDAQLDSTRMAKL